MWAIAVDDRADGSGLGPTPGRLVRRVARNVIDYLILAFEVVLGRPRSDRHLTHLVAERAVAVDADSPLVVQADGEIIVTTPVAAKLVPGDDPRARLPRPGEQQALRPARCLPRRPA